MVDINIEWPEVNTYRWDVPLKENVQNIVEAVKEVEENSVPNTPEGRTELAESTELSNAFAGKSIQEQVESGRLSPTFLSAAYVGAPSTWAATTAYPKNAIVINAGSAYVALADVPSRATFTPADWQPLGAADGVPVLMLGDSIIFGQGTTNPTTNGVVPRTAARLTTLLGPTYTVINAGIGGHTTGQMLARLAALLATYRPKIVTLSATVNDTRINNTGTQGSTIPNLRKMIAMVRLAGALPVLITNTPFDYVRFGSANYDATSAAARPVQVAAVRALAAELGVILADVDAAFAQAPDFPTTYTSDGLHPNNTGADLWAYVIASAIAAQPPVLNLGNENVIASDSFDRADTTAGTLGSTDNALGGSASLAWTADSLIRVLNGRAGSLALSGSSQFGRVNTGRSDHRVDFTLAQTLAGVRAVLRFSSSTTHYSATVVSASRIDVDRRVGGVKTTLASATTLSLSESSRMGFAVAGSTLKLYVNGAEILSITDESPIALTNFAGFGSPSSGAFWVEDIIFAQQ